MLLIWGYCFLDLHDDEYEFEMMLSMGDGMMILLLLP